MTGEILVLTSHADQTCTTIPRPIHRSPLYLVPLVEVLFQLRSIGKLVLDGVTQLTFGYHSGRATLFQVAGGLHRDFRVNCLLLALNTSPNRIAPRPMHSFGACVQYALRLQPGDVGTGQCSQTSTWRYDRLMIGFV